VFANDFTRSTNGTYPPQLVASIAQRPATRPTLATAAMITEYGSAPRTRARPEYIGHLLDRRRRQAGGDGAVARGRSSRRAEWGLYTHNVDDRLEPAPASIVATPAGQGLIAPAVRPADD